MSQSEEPHYRRRIATAQITTVISITLVLFLVGLMGIVILHAGKLADHVRENIGFSILFKEDVREPRILEIKKNIDRQSWVKESEYIPREKAAERLRQELGEDFIGFLGYNPLLPSIELRIRAAYTAGDSLAGIERRLAAWPEIAEVFYQRSLVDAINRNVERISLTLLGFSLILFFIAVALINNTIRLSIYSRRFLIRSMQLVGATEGFIRRPLLWRSILQGIVSAIFALVLLTGAGWFALLEVPELAELHDPFILIFLASGVLVLGTLISFASTWLAVGKYLRLQTDRLYG